MIQRAVNALGKRPAILIGEIALAADETRRFRSISAHIYDAVDDPQASKAAATAARRAKLLPSQIARFRQTIDP